MKTPWARPACMLYVDWLMNGSCQTYIRGVTPGMGTRGRGKGTLWYTAATAVFWGSDRQVYSASYMQYYGLQCKKI